MKTVAQRWVEASVASGVAALPAAQRAAFMLTFYGGFIACVQATMELAELPEAEAMARLQAMHAEISEVHSLAEQAIYGGTVQ